MWLVVRLPWRLLTGASLVVSVGAVGVLGPTGNNWFVASLQYLFLFVTGAQLANHRADISAWYRHLPAGLRITLGVASLFLLSTFGLAHAPIQALRGFAYIAPDFGAVLLLLAIIGSRRVQSMLEKAPCLWLGRVSYSLYLSHLVVLLTLVFVMHRFLPIMVILAILPPLALAIAGILYRVVEAPAIAAGQILAGRIDRRIGKDSGRSRGVRAAVLPDCITVLER
jgi:peptidoglycan/LPS O-acetylase OafA/YrhL